MVIKDFQYVQETPEAEPESLPKNTKKFRRRRKKQDMTPRLYVVDMTVMGYNQTLKFVGTYNEDHCIEMVAGHQDDFHPIDLNDMAKAWMDIVEQQEAFLLHIATHSQETEPEKKKRVIPKVPKSERSQLNIGVPEKK